MPVALPYDVRLRLLRVTHGRTDGQFGINMVGSLRYNGVRYFHSISSCDVSLYYCSIVYCIISMLIVASADDDEHHIFITYQLILLKNDDYISAVYIAHRSYYLYSCFPHSSRTYYSRSDFVLVQFFLRSIYTHAPPGASSIRSSRSNEAVLRETMPGVS